MSQLIAIRRAAWPLHDGLIRSTELERLAALIEQLDVERKAMSEQIVAKLYATIPRVEQRSCRATLLELKRDIHNLRPVNVAQAKFHAADSGGLSEALRRYMAATSRRLEVLEIAERCASKESRRQLLKITARESYKLAVSASSKSLAARWSRGHAAVENPSERDLRSFYAYVCRFSTKANPLHLFASISLEGAGQGSGTRGSENACEVVFDVEAILRIEARVLAVAQDKTRIRLQKRPLVRRPDGWEVWIRNSSGGISIAQMRHTPVLDNVSSIFDGRAKAGASPTLTLAEFEDALSALLPPSANAEEVTRSLLRVGVIVPYLCDHMQSPGRFLKGFDSSHDQVAAILERWHLSRVSAGDLKQLDGALGTIASHVEGSSITYHVNTYSKENMVRGRAAATEVSRELEELKGVFLLANNFARSLRRNRALLRSVLSEDSARSYLDVLKLSLRSIKNESDQSAPESSPNDLDAITNRAGKLDGQLTHAELVELGSAGISERDEAALCYVGSFDFRSRIFYLNNVLAGHGRFIGRYFGGDGHTTEAAHGDRVDVEIAMPREHSLSFVRRKFDTGFGFESRWASRYRNWIEPEQILVRLANGRPVFVDAVSGRELRFHYRGGLLATLIPHEYQLLLQDHADYYRNIFAVHTEQPVPRVIEHRQALTYGRVCLRRETWLVSRGDLLTRIGCLGVQEWLAFRRWVYESLAVAELWYYRIVGAGSRAGKPLFMDVSSLQSLRAFRHVLSKSVHGCVELSKMTPETSGMWQVDGSAYVAELMIEV